MARRPMTPAETMVGRRMPPPPRHIDTVMASFVTADGFCGRIEPDESWLRPAHKKARRAGWLTYSGMSLKFQGDRRSSGLWYLTPTGEKEALEAKARKDAAEAARREWAFDHDDVLRARRGLAPRTRPERSDDTSVQSPPVSEKGDTDMTTDTGATTAEDLRTEDNVTGASVGGFFARDNYSDGDLIAATKVTNTKVYNKDGDKVGWLDEVVLEKTSGRVAYVVLAVGGFLGIGERYHRLPWERLVYDESKGGYNIDLTGDEVRSAPHYSRDEVHAAGLPERI